MRAELALKKYWKNKKHSQIVKNKINLVDKNLKVYSDYIHYRLLVMHINVFITSNIYTTDVAQPEIDDTDARGTLSRTVCKPTHPG